MTKDVDYLSIWMAHTLVESSKDGEFFLTKRKMIRPVLIIDNRAYLVFKITSQTWHEGYHIIDLKTAGLYEESIIRTDVVLPIADSDLIRKMGYLGIDDAERLIEYQKEHPPKRRY